MKIRSRQSWWELAGAAAFSLANLLAADPLFALPQYRGDGSANIQGLKTGENASIRVTAERGLVRWHSFSVSPGEVFRIQGSPSQFILNQVTGPHSSQIGGLIESGPRFLLVNPNGIEIFGTGRIIAPSIWLSSGVLDADAWLNRTGDYYGRPNEYLNISLERGSSINLNGTLLARDGSVGGVVGIFADSIDLGKTASIDATGPSGGGSILVGGSWQNNKPQFGQATSVTIASGAVLNASATNRGPGGTIVAWTDVHNPVAQTYANGQFLANGGPRGGDGGRIETSGYWLSTDSATGSAAAVNGRAGLWLFDPYDIEIISGPGSLKPSGGNFTAFLIARPSAAPR